MHREILNDLEKWKDKSRRKPLILTGVRQCGKTYIVNEFARKNFESYVYVNFESDETLAAIFDYDFDVDRIIKELEQHFKIQITPGKTLIFFDEIQECTRAITSLKYFCEKKRELHVVCAGSLLGVALKKKLKQNWLRSRNYRWKVRLIKHILRCICLISVCCEPNPKYL